MRLLLGFSGKIGSGKNTSVDVCKTFLETQLGGSGVSVREVSFASALKGAVVAATNCHLEDVHTRAGKERYLHAWGTTVGVLLQGLGEWARSTYREDVWVDTLFEGYDPSREVWLISDVRYPNEARRSRGWAGS